jgi:nucleotide-binding universal stress UspA family protein
MRITRRTKAMAFFIALGTCLVSLAVALNVSWIIFHWRQVVPLVLGIILFGLLIAGLVMNTIFLVREIRRNEQQDSFLNAVTQRSGADSERVLRYASRAVEAVGAHLTLVHVIPANGAELTVQLDLEERLESAKREAARRRIEELQIAAGAHAPVRIAAGAVKDMLTEEARRLRADVLVMGRSPQSGALGRMRDLSYAVVRDAPWLCV